MESAPMREDILSETPEPGSVTLFWFEQSHFLLKTPGGRLIHTDPYLSRTVSPENFIHPKPLLEPGGVPASHAFLTHDHRDHTDPDTIGPMAGANPDCRFYGPAESCARLRSLGIPDSHMQSVSAGDTVSLPELSVRVVHAENTEERNATTHLGFIFNFDSLVVYMVGDTRTDPDSYREQLEPVVGLRPDVMIVPINEGYNNPGPFGARRFVELVEPDRVIPCHFGCFRHNTIDPQIFIDALDPALRSRVSIMSRGGVERLSRNR